MYVGFIELNEQPDENFQNRYINSYNAEYKGSVTVIMRSSTKVGKT
jgi:hypothetical protein